jgi:hypothetical protein
VALVIFGIVDVAYFLSFVPALVVLIWAIVRAIQLKQWGWAAGLVPLCVTAFLGLPFLGPSLYFIWFIRDSVVTCRQQPSPALAAAAASKT